MTRFLFIVFLALSLWGCKPGVPKEITQPKEMENILFDIHVLDGYVSEIPSADSAKKLSAPMYKGIFKKYGSDSATHAKSMVYYYARPDLLTKIYDNITVRLEKNKVIELEKVRKADSVIQAKAAIKVKKELALLKADSIKKAKLAKQKDSVKQVVKKTTKLGSELPTVNK